MMVYISRRTCQKTGKRYLLLSYSETDETGKSRQMIYGYIGTEDEYPHLASTIGGRVRRGWDDPLIQRAKAIVDSRRG